MPEQTIRSANVASFFFAVEGVGDSALNVIGFKGTEALSELFHFDVELCSKDPAIDTAKLLGKPCRLLIEGGIVRYVDGMVMSFARTGEGTTVTYYAAEIVPVHWLLSQRHATRAYQRKTVPQIIEQVFKDAGIPPDRFRMLTTAEYENREFVVQYRESDLDFISRLMEHEGIFYFFEHDKNGHRMVMGDHPSALPSGSTTIPFRETTGLVPQDASDFIFGVCNRDRICPGSTCLKDFDFASINAQFLTGTAESGTDSGLEFYDYPGEFPDDKIGGRLAQVRREEFKCQQRVQEMSTNATQFGPADRIRLFDHPVNTLNQEYRVTHVTHEGRQPQSAEQSGVEEGFRYEAKLRTIRSDVPFRPPRKTRRPTVTGSQTAIVVGPEGDEIHTDEFGRVRVQFHWDRDGEYDGGSSCWIRVSQGAAGGGYGMMFLPRVGQEVIVDFLEGNPDRPIITGRVYNRAQMPPYPLPEHKTRSVIKTHSSLGGGGTNEIRFEDLKDEEQILIYAQRNMHVRANGSRCENVGEDQHLTVNDDKYELVKKSKHAEVKLDLNEKIGGQFSLEVEGNLVQQTGGNISHTAAGDLYLKSDKKLILEAKQGITFKCGGNFINIDSTGVTVMGKKVKVNSGGVAGLGQVMQLAAPKTPREADTAEPGADTLYQASKRERGKIAVGSIAADRDGGEVVKVKPSWVEIAMVDETGQPWPDEPFEITVPGESEPIRGTLGPDGRRFVRLPRVVKVDVSFPNLDGRAWRKRGDTRTS